MPRSTTGGVAPSTTSAALEGPAERAANDLGQLDPAPAQPPVGHVRSVHGVYACSRDASRDDARVAHAPLAVIEVHAPPGQRTEHEIAGEGPGLGEPHMNGRQLIELMEVH